MAAKRPNTHPSVLFSTLTNVRTRLLRRVGGRALHILLGAGVISSMLLAPLGPALAAPAAQATDTETPSATATITEAPSPTASETASETPSETPSPPQTDT